MDRQTIRNILSGLEDESIQGSFLSAYSGQIDHFILLMEQAFKSWDECDKIVLQNPTAPNAFITALVYTALHSHIVALKLFLTGLMVPSGNTQRYVLECIAMAFLLARPSLGVAKNYMENKYSTTKAVSKVIKHHKLLGLNKEATETLGSHIKHYDKFSHPTILSLSAVMTIQNPNPQIILGGAYDAGKTFVYDREIASRICLAKVFPNIIEAVKINFEAEAQQ